MGNKITYEDFRKEKKKKEVVIYLMPSDVMAFEKPNSCLLIFFCLYIVMLIFSFLAQKFKQPRPHSGSKQVALSWLELKHDS